MSADRAANDIAASFDTYLRANGLVRTAQRHAVVAHILDGPPHFDVEELVDLVRRERAGVSRATVYRTVGYLEKAGIIRKMDFNEPHAHYEVAARCGHHEHLVCERCGTIIEFTDPLLEERIRKTAALQDMDMTKHRVEIFGICRKCREKKRS
jgi:Fur family ferric uptake transcriptional regulator